MYPERNVDWYRLYAYTGWFIPPIPTLLVSVLRLSSRAVTGQSGNHKCRAKISTILKNRGVIRENGSAGGTERPLRNAVQRAMSDG